MTINTELNTTALDCFDIVDSCELLTSVLLESQDPNECRAAQKCLETCLDALEISFAKPLSAARIEQLTADCVSEEPHPYFYQDSEMLRQYCQALNQALISNTLEAADAALLTGLLFDLTGYMADDLKAPRFARSTAIH